MSGAEQFDHAIECSFIPNGHAFEPTNNFPSDAVVNVDHGDPTVFESYWRKMEDKCSVVFAGHESLSYFADHKKNMCFFMESKFEESVKRLHKVVGNAVVDDRYIVVGTGSSQLIQALLYALSPPDQPKPVSVVSAAPYYSCYQEMTEFLQSRLHKWEGDAHSFDKDGPYIELVSSPNNPDGVCREGVVKRDGGKVIYDFAYYWPQYTAITAPADHDIMLFTVSKCTGHAGSRIGWALVKDVEVATKMIKFIQISTVGVSKEAQIRAAKILDVVSDGCEDLSHTNGLGVNFFQYSHKVLAERWQKLTQAFNQSELFTLVADYPVQYCNFAGDYKGSFPGFAWIKCSNKIGDLEKFLKAHKIITRGGKRFGVDEKYVRASIMGREEEFDLLLERLLMINKLANEIGAGK